MYWMEKHVAHRKSVSSEHAKLLIAFYLLCPLNEKTRTRGTSHVRYPEFCPASADAFPFLARVYVFLFGSGTWD